MITKAPPNPEHIAILSDALSHLVLERPIERPKGGYSDKLIMDDITYLKTMSDSDWAHASVPLRCFQAKLNEIDDGFGMKDMDATGWKYLVHFRHVLAVAEIREVDGEACFGRLIQGDLPIILRSAADKASGMLDDRPESFEPRIVEVPALYVFALWLHGDRDDYVFSGKTADGGLVVQDAARFVMELKIAKQGRSVAGRGAP